jgi:hypothetical protein
MGDVQFEVFLAALQAPLLERVYWWSQVALTCIALVSAWIAIRQLRGIRESREAAVHIARATFLLDLDRRWDGSEMVNARKLLARTLIAAKEAVGSANSLINDNERERLAAIEFSKTLGSLRKSNLDDYQSLMGTSKNSLVF